MTIKEQTYPDIDLRGQRHHQLLIGIAPCCLACKQHIETNKGFVKNATPKYKLKHKYLPNKISFCKEKKCWQLSNSDSSRQVFIGIHRKGLGISHGVPNDSYGIYFIRLLPIFLLYSTLDGLCGLVKSDCLHPGRCLPTDLYSQVPLLREG